jgi:hypothetical protein
MTDIAKPADWHPSQVPSRPADNTEGIHRVIAIIYAGLLAIALVACLIGGRELTTVLAVTAVLGGVAALHAALSFGARRRSGIAKVGSFLVGLLMLPAFPIGTVVGGMLIYNAAQTWPPRRVGPVAPAAPDLRNL